MAVPLANAGNDSGVTTVGDLDGNFKEIYASKLADHRPRSLKFLRDIKFLPKDKAPGNEYHQPVQLQLEHGFTYADADAGAFKLNEPIVGATKDAKVIGFQTLLRSRMDYETAARSSTGGKRAFVQGTKLIVREMTVGFRKRSELDMVNGRQGIGKVKEVGDNFIIIDKADWIPGAWAGAEGAEVEFWDGSTLANPTADNGRSPGDATADTVTAGVVEKVEFSQRKIHFTATSINIDLGTDTVAADDLIFFKGARQSTGAYNIPLGIRDILILGAATTSTTVFNIDVSLYSLWQASSSNVADKLTFTKVNEAIVEPTGKGLEEDLCLYVTPAIWADLINEEGQHRRWPNHKGDRYTVGAEDIEFHSQNGTIKIKSSLYMPQGEGIMIPPSLWNVVGATDMTFNLPGRGDSFFFHTPENAAFELRCYRNAACFTEAPGKATRLHTITVPGD